MSTYRDEQPQESGASVAASVAVLGWDSLASLCWQASSKQRRAAHQRSGTPYCGTLGAPYTPGESGAPAPAATCLDNGCYDAFHDLLALARTKLDELATRGSFNPREAAHYTARLLTRLQTDRARQRRLGLGLAAKPGRPDGAARHVIAALHAGARDTENARYLEALFRFLRDYAHTEGRRSVAWPVDVIATIKTEYDHLPRVIGDTEVRDEIAADIRLVLRTAEESVGAQWVHRMIWHPLMACVVAASIDEEDRLAAGGTLELEVLKRWAHEEYLQNRAMGMAPTQAFLAAGRTVAGDAPPMPDAAVLALLEELDADLPGQQGCE